MDDASTIVTVWWAGLSCVALLNCCLWLFVWRVHLSRKDVLVPEAFRNRSWLLALSAIYVIGCGFRSILPRMDVARIVMVDSWISSVVVGRSVATIAELAFVAQWALLLREISRGTGNRTIAYLALPIVPIIFVAEICSWYGVLTTNSLGNAVEESIWALTAVLAVIGFLLARPYYQGVQRKFLNAAVFLGSGYVLYMVAIDVPAYLAKYRVAEEAGRTYLSISDGFTEVVTQWTVSRAYDDWSYAIVWMSLYFSIAVWISLSMVVAPALSNGTARRSRSRSPR
jgi:hypothetical protein